MDRTGREQTPGTSTDSNTNSVCPAYRSGNVIAETNRSVTCPIGGNDDLSDEDDEEDDVIFLNREEVTPVIVEGPLKITHVQSLPTQMPTLSVSTKSAAHGFTKEYHKFCQEREELKERITESELSNGQGKRAMNNLIGDKIRRLEIRLAKSEAEVNNHRMALTKLANYVGSLPAPGRALIQRIIDRQKRESETFHKCLWDFAKNIYDMSPASYRYIRQQFGENLPLPEDVSAYQEPQY